MMFRVGQKVVCVNASTCSYGSVCGELTKGRIYEVSGFKHWSDGDCYVYLVGVQESWHPDRFRPIVERKADISALKALLVPGSKITEPA
jgi:hypothetical protein